MLMFDRTPTSRSAANSARKSARLLPMLALSLTTAASFAQSPAPAPSSMLVAHQDRRGLVERSDIILQRPNQKNTEAMPLGNGKLGVAVWSQDGFTAQLNRADTYPARLSPGQLVLPQLTKLTEAPDYQARLNLYDGEFTESGGGMKLTAWVDDALDALVIEVAGADPQQTQTARLELWQPRRPHAAASGATGVLSETWLDDKESGASHQIFGSLAAITADAQDVHATTADPLSVELTFKPRSDGSFRILVAAPSWAGGDASAAASRLLASAQSTPADAHRAAWHGYWDHIDWMQLSSPDHAAEYFENLRTIDLYAAAAESRGHFPGGQAGIGDLFSSMRDAHQWGPSAYWHWNLRMQVSANLGAGAAALNQPYFRLYRENLDNILAWTRLHMGNRPGVCVPETMRFNGRGYENETWIKAAALNCAEDSKPYYNARTLSTGLEVSLWVWNQYDYTGDLAFLKENYPLMREAARFLLAYARHDPGGALHTYPSNAHEMQWDVHDPTTDISAMRAVFPLIIRAATLLHTDADLVRELQAAVKVLPDLPLATIQSPKALAQPGVDDAQTIIATSYNPEAKDENSENIGLEPVWPYGLIGDDGPRHDLGVRTFLHRPNKNIDDWSYDPVQAARLGLADELKASLLALTEKYQTYPSGFASFAGGPEFYVEQIGIVSDALQQALADDHDDLIRIAPAWPRDWDANGEVSLRHQRKAIVDVHDGKILRVALVSGSAGPVRIRNPWPGEPAEILDAHTGSVILSARADAVLAFHARASGNYLLRPAGQSSMPAAHNNLSATPATAPKALGSRTIGLFK